MMSQELLYTSAARGLKPGSRGFCTVLTTQGMAAPLTTALEGLSGYRPVYPAGDPRADRNPIVYSHLKLQSSGRTVNVLSRIADFGLDYSQRANKLAHHVVLDRTELLSGGPANLLLMAGFMREEWSGEPTVIALKPVKRETDPPRGVCRAWQELTGDAGWAGVLAESFLQAPDRLVVLLFAPGQNILPLFNEAISLLPVERRWDVTFSTYFTGLTTGTTCSWRAMIHDSKEAHESLRFVNALRVDLTSESLGRATGGPLVEAARNGSRPHDNSSRSTSRTGPSDVVFAEAEQVRVEFSSDDRTPASFRRTAASPQPSRPPQGQAAPPPQPPPEREPSYRMLPAEPTSTQPARPVRRLSDVIEAESQRPGFSLGTWLGLGGLALSVAALLSVMYMDRAHKDDGQGDLAKDQSGQHSQDSKKTTAGKGDGSGNKPGKIITPTPPDSKPEDAHQTVAANDTASKDTAKSPTEADATASVSKPDPVPMPPTSNDGKPPKEAAPQTASQGTTPAKPAPPTIPFEPMGLPTAVKAAELHQFDVPKGKSLNDYLKKSPDGSPAWRGVLPEMVLLKPEWQHYVDGKVPADIAKDQPSAMWAILDKSIDPDKPVAIGLFIATDREAPTVKYRLTSRDHTKTAELGWYRIRILSPVPGNPPIKDIGFSQFRIGDDKFPLSREFQKYVLIWKLLASASVESTEQPQSKPKLVLDRLIIKLGGQTISLAGESRDPQSVWTSSLDEFTSQARESFPDNSGPASNKLELKMELTSGKEGPEIRLQLTGVPKFLKGIESELTGSLKLAEKEVPKHFTALYCKPKDDPEKDPQVTAIKELLVKCKTSDPVGSADIRRKIQQALVEARQQLKSEDDNSRKKELESAIDKLPELDQLYESVEKFPPLEKSLNNVTVISARLYYTLTGTTKNAAGETITLTEDVDVVNFDDSKQAGERRGNRKDRDAKKLVGEGSND